MDPRVLVVILSVFASNTLSLPYPIAVPFPQTDVYGPPSGYGSPSGHGSGSTAYGSVPGIAINVDTDASNQILTPLSNLGDTVNDKINLAVNSKQIQFVPPFPGSGRKTAVLESSFRESIPIQADIKYGNLQQFVANLLNPRPIVDTIQEHEKYGNDGGKGRAVSTALVSVAEGLSNALNAAVDVPFQAARTIGKKITNTLNPVGAKLVGLA